MIPDFAHIVFVGLNPTPEVLRNTPENFALAVFSRDESFWNILLRAGLSPNLSEIPLRERAQTLFVNQIGIHPNCPLGFADLLQNVFEVDARRVVVPRNSATMFLSEKISGKRVMKLALMGQKVVDAFHRDFRNFDLCSWNDIPIVNGRKDFGKIGSIEFEGNSIDIFALPFPVNNNVPDKHVFYNRLL